jgi:hypothetical protein
LFENVDELRWNGPHPDFAAVCERLELPSALVDRGNALLAKTPTSTGHPASPKRR